MTAGAVPGRPEAETMLAPGTFPASCPRGLAPGTGMSSAVTCATVKGSFFTSVAPDTPVTTTWLRRFTSCLSWKSCDCEPAETVMVFTAGT